MPGGAPARIVVCGLGPGGPDRLTEATAAVLAGPDPVRLRTARHPSADRAVDAVSFDEVYERAGSFDEIYRAIAAEVIAAAADHGRVVYAVPGSPLVLERSVRYLRTAVEAEDQVDVELMPALSFLDEVWARLGVDPVDDGVRMVDGLRFAADAADQRGPLLVPHVHSQWVLSDIKLALDVGPEQSVTVLQRLGTDQERVFEVPWPELDRAVEADHLTTLYLPEVVGAVGFELARSVEMMGRLRRDCPWDREQTHRSLRRFLIEETYEVVEAIDRLEAAEPGSDAEGRAYAELEEELGDLWFQVLFHAELAAEAGQFALDDVARTLTDKMIQRHPHVYGDSDPAEAASVAGWERMKQQEKLRDSAMDDIPGSLPALTLAEKTLKRAAGAGTPIDPGPASAELGRLLPEGSDDRDVGSLLLAVVEQARRRGVHAEEALREAVGRAAARYRAAESSGPVPGDWVRG